MSKSELRLIQLEISDEDIRKKIILNVLTMLKNRGVIDMENIKPSVEKFIESGHNDDIYKVALNKDGKFIYIKYIDQKITNINKSSNIGVFLQSHAHEQKIILVKAINNKIQQLILSDYQNTEIFTTDKFTEDIAQNKMVDKHELLSEEDGEEIIKLYGSKKQMPKILSCDPMARYYNMPKGRICKIYRSSEASGVAPYYRVVI